MTRFGEILPLRQNIRDIWRFLRVYLELGIKFTILWHILNAIGQFFIVVQDQI